MIITIDTNNLETLFVAVVALLGAITAWFKAHSAQQAIKNQPLLVSSPSSALSPAA